MAPTQAVAAAVAAIAFVSIPETLWRRSLDTLKSARDGTMAHENCAELVEMMEAEDAVQAKLKAEAEPAKEPAKEADPLAAGEPKEAGDPKPDESSKSPPEGGTNLAGAPLTTTAAVAGVGTVAANDASPSSSDPAAA